MISDELKSFPVVAGLEIAVPSALRGGNYDRQVYMTNGGELVFGVYPGSTKYIRTPAVYNDGQWHQVVATCGGGTIRLYVDGEQIKSAAATGAQTYNGYWRVGGDNLSGWPIAPSSYYFNGTVDEFAVYSAVLDPSSIAQRYALGIG